VKNIGLIGTNNNNSSINFNSTLDNKFRNFKILEVEEDLYAKKRMKKFLSKAKFNEYKIKFFSLFK
jgi:hypothetical protein